MLAGKIFLLQTCEKFKCLNGQNALKAGKSCGGLLAANILTDIVQRIFSPLSLSARLAQSVEHETLNLRVVGSSPTLGVKLFLHCVLPKKQSICG